MPQQIHKANKAKRVAIDFGTTGTGIARYDESTEMACLVPVGWNVTEDSTRTRLPSAMLVTQFEDRVDMSLVLFDNVSNLRAKKESEGKVVSSRIIASPKLLLDKARCKNGQLYEDASYLEKIIKDEVDIDSIETWCLTVPVMYTKADESSEEMQDSMTREMITAARTVINKDYNINDGLEFESEPVAVMTHLAAQRSQRYENQGPILVWDAGGSTVDLAAAIVIGGAFELIIAGGASSGTYYMWEELNKCCGFDQQKFSFAKKAVEAMTEPCDITETGVSKGDVEILMKISYASALSETLTMLTNLERRGYSAPKILVVGRAPGANQMIKDFLVSALTEKCVRVFGNSTSKYIEVLDGLDVGTSVCRGAALPYSSDPVQAFTEATVAVCYRAEGGRDLPKEFRGRDNALVVIKDSGVEQLSRQWLSCQVDGPPKGFVVHLHVIVSEREPYTYEDETGKVIVTQQLRLIIIHSNGDGAPTLRVPLIK
ncbi:hypothetical protein G3M48_003376 [Beauveria asiatica]|uniref:Uncharacterized protein n=1 Tax=Beauveria asiatica TaxID=1069075 RepID=A0AAW0RW54_9HYPO